MLIKDEDGNTARVDSTTGAVTMIGSVHKRIHDGGLFAADVVNESVAAAAAIAILVRTNANVPHVRVIASIGGDARLTLSEAPVTTADGSAVAIQDRNRTSGLSTTVEIFSGPTVTNAGTNLLDTIQATGAGGGLFPFEEFVLKEDTDYLLTLKNISPAAQPGSVQLDFYIGG